MTVIFFQAEDGIRDHCVTGVQTCALPISRPARGGPVPSVSGGSQSEAHRHVPARQEIGRASCRERVYLPVVAVALKKEWLIHSSSQTAKNRQPTQRSNTHRMPLAPATERS